MAGRIAYYGNIVRDGLILDLDAAKRDSYPGSGTAWRDIAGNIAVGSLINSPTFNPDNGGSIVFDGVDDYASIPFTYDVYNGGNTNPITMCGWFKLPPFQIFVAEENPGGFQDASIFMGFWVYRVTASPNTQVRFNAIFGGVGGSERSAYHTMDGQWKYYTATLTSSGLCTMYINGVYQNQGSPVITSNAKFNGTVFLVKDRSRTPVNCSISGIQIYNRALSASEITQNYNATKTRYGL